MKTVIETDYELNNKGYMKRAVLLSVLLGTMPLLSMAQDDLYFTPSKAEQSAYQQHKMEEDGPAFYSGIGKSSDEYNRRGQYNYKKIGVDSLGNDIFMSHVSTLHGDSVVLDTIYGGFTRKYEGTDDDFAYSRRMSRFDGFWGGYYDPWFMGRASVYAGWGWPSPYYYSGWYDTWYDPWYYGYYSGYPYYGYGYYYGGYPYYRGYPYYYGYAGYGWYGPWRGYYGWGYPYYGYRRAGYYAYGGHTGTANHWGRSNGSYRGSVERGGSYGNFSGYRGSTGTMSQGNAGQFGGNSVPDRSNIGQFGGSRQSYGNQGTRSYSAPNSSYSPPPNSSFGGATRSTFGGGSFGGSRAGGGSFGGTRSGGGGFGGHR